MKSELIPLEPLIEKEEPFQTISTPMEGGEAEAERRRIIVETIDRLRPGMQADGGDLELVEIDGFRVKVRLKGACVSCGMANETLGGIRRSLVDALGRGPILVVPAL